MTRISLRPPGQQATWPRQCHHCKHSDARRRGRGGQNSTHNRRHYHHGDGRSRGICCTHRAAATGQPPGHFPTSRSSPVPTTNALQNPHKPLEHIHPSRKFVPVPTYRTHAYRCTGQHPRPMGTGGGGNEGQGMGAELRATRAVTTPMPSKVCPHLHKAPTPGGP